MKVEQALAEEGKTKEDLGRAEFERRVWEWREEHGGQITNQFKRLGASLDYSDERFTMDDAYVRAVAHVFVRLYENGLIYRDNYMVNWDPGTRSAISDLEVEQRTQEDTLYMIDYPLASGGGSVTVATVRPETMLADTAIAVNPADERYTRLIGEHAILPLVGRRLPIIADDYVKTDFGTGALKITPGHDPNDFEIGRRHGLEEISAIGEDGRMTEAATERFAGLAAEEARAAVVAALREEGLVSGTQPYTHDVPFSHRSGMRIEPLISLQWFCDMEKLAGPAIAALDDGELRFHPRNQGDVYRRWLENIRPWCVSRQLWWGHQIPAWYRGDETYVGLEPPEGEGWERDPDVLDTWFSSALWPFATLGWPRGDPAAEGLLPRRRPVDGAGHHLPVGRPHGDVRHRPHRRAAVPRRADPRRHPGARRPPDVEVARHRDRPARRDRRTWGRCRAVRPARHVVDPGRALLRRAGAPGARSRQQALERVAPDPDPGRSRRACRRPTTPRPPRTAGSCRGWSGSPSARTS